MKSVAWTDILKTIPSSRGFPADPDLTFSSLACHSDDVTPGSLFFAIPGTVSRGILFVGKALAKGAVACVIAEEEAALFSLRHPETPHITTPDVRTALAKVAPLFFPGQPPFIAAVTGTNGKTSIAHFARQLWSACLGKAASMGTLGLQLAGVDACQKLPLFPEGLSTAGPIHMHQCLDWMQTQDIPCCIMEASSHGIHQKRLHGIAFKVGVWTNLSRDHLDYHETMEAYTQAKETLFQELVAHHGQAILHNALPNLASLREVCTTKGIQVWTYGGAPTPDIEAKTDLALLHTTPHARGQDVTISIWGRQHTFSIPFCGTFQAENLLAALAVVHASGVPIAEALQAFDILTAVPGRLELAGITPSGGAVYIDYAHTPHALESSLLHLRAHTKQKLHVVFGCGGNRDQGKRPQMGEVAHRCADQVIITDDNPRDEDPGSIRAQILSACPSAREIGDRKDAIQHAIEKLTQGDALLIAGKGHEAYQIRRNETSAFNDKLVAQQMLTHLFRRPLP